MDNQLLTLIAPFAAFGAVCAGVWGIAQAFGSKENRASERLDVLKDPLRRNQDPGKEAGISSVFNKAAPTLSKALVPKTELETSALRVKLANAGFGGPTDMVSFLAFKVVAMIVGGILTATGSLMTLGFTTDSLIATCFGAGMGMFLPDLLLSFLASSRKQKIFLSLPDALDLMVVCVEAGLGLDAAMRRVAEELNGTAKELCGEINHANFQLQMGRPRREVLHDLGVRTGVDDVKSLAAILIQADKFGSSIATALRVQSDSMRVKRSQLAEEKAAMTAVKMIFPLVLFIFPGIFVVLVGPAAIMMIRQLLVD
ncbi:type II secretion system F family protein [Planctomicrobium sp. SH527]|uniref:type II secretion system F family protein n=1 Tax=Planctomicrobium sp. SH527 TaxID=3448123 RepID=UPI003F5BCF7E